MRKASETWCPFVRLNGGRRDGMPTPSPTFNRKEQSVMCIGSKCSAWQNINHHSMEELAEVIEGQYGRCGLSNGGLMEDE